MGHGSPPPHLPYQIWTPKYEGRYLDAVVLVCPEMRPTAAIGTDHIRSMTDRPKHKSIIFPLDDLLMANTQSQPITGRFLDPKRKTFSTFSTLYPGFHDGEFIPWAFDCLDGMFIDQFDILVSELLSECISRRIPNAEIVEKCQKALLMLRKSFISFAHAGTDGFSYVRTGSLERCDQLLLCDAPSDLLLLPGNDSNQFF